MDPMNQVRMLSSFLERGVVQTISKISGMLRNGGLEPILSSSVS